MGLAAFNRMRRLRAQQAPAPHTEPKQAPEPVHIGGGWYEVNGEKYQGKAAADEAARKASE